MVFLLSCSIFVKDFDDMDYVNVKKNFSSDFSENSCSSVDNDPLEILDSIDGFDVDRDLEDWEREKKEIIFNKEVVSGIDVILKDFSKDLKPSGRRVIYSYVVPKFNEDNHIEAYKFGDTACWRTSVRAEEWRKVYPHMKMVDTVDATVEYDDGSIGHFRDYDIHRLLREQEYFNLKENRDKEIFGENEDQPLVIDQNEVRKKDKNGEPYLSSEFWGVSKNEVEKTRKLRDFMNLAKHDFLKNLGCRFPETVKINYKDSAIDYRKQPEVSFVPFGYQHMAITEMYEKLAAVNSGKIKDPNDKKILLVSGAGSGKTNIALWAVKAMLNGYSKKNQLFHETNF